MSWDKVNKYKLKWKHSQIKISLYRLKRKRAASTQLSRFN